MTPELAKLQTKIQTVIASLDLGEKEKTWLEMRFLDELLTLEQLAGQAYNRFFGLKTTYQVSSLLLPTLISIDAGENFHLGTLSLLVSAVAAIASSVEQLYSLGDTYVATRGTVEKLKRHFHEFDQGVGQYAGFASARAAFPAFVSTVEDLLFKNAVATAKHLDDDDQTISERDALV